MGSFAVEEPPVEEWQLATALALAYLRQRTELFELVEPIYQSGASRVSPGLLQRAVHAVVSQSRVSDGKESSASSSGEVGRQVASIHQTSSGAARVLTPAKITQAEMAATLPQEPIRPRILLPADRRASLDALKVDIATLFGCF